jgi:hypothetical protein
MNVLRFAYKKKDVVCYFARPNKSGESNMDGTGGGDKKLCKTMTKTEFSGIGRCTGYRISSL